MLTSHAFIVFELNELLFPKPKTVPVLPPDPAHALGRLTMSHSSRMAAMRLPSSPAPFSHKPYKPTSLPGWWCGGWPVGLYVVTWVWDLENNSHLCLSVEFSRWKKIYYMLLFRVMHSLQVLVIGLKGTAFL